MPRAKKRGQGPREEAEEAEGGGAPPEAYVAAALRERERQSSRQRLQSGLYDLVSRARSPEAAAADWSSWIRAQSDEDWETLLLKAVDASALEVCKQADRERDFDSEVEWFLNLVNLDALDESEVAACNTKPCEVYFIVCLATKSKGVSHLVQYVLEVPAARQERGTWSRRNQLAVALADFTPVLRESMHGHHILQSLVKLPVPDNISPERWCRYLVLSIFARTLDMATLANQYSSRVLDQLVQHCRWTEEQLNGLLDFVGGHAAELMRSEFGNFVVKRLFERYPKRCAGIGRQILDLGPDGLAELSMHRHASHVLEAFLRSAEESSGSLSRFFAELAKSDKIVDVVCSECGPHVLLCLDPGASAAGPKLKELLEEEWQRLQDSKFGQKVIDHFGLQTPTASAPPSKTTATATASAPPSKTSTLTSAATATDTTIAAAPMC